MRNAVFLTVAFLLILIEGNLYRVLGPVGHWLGPQWIHGVTPNLLLPLVVFLGVQEPSMTRGAVLCFSIGYFQDALAGAPIGLFAFVFVMIWWLSRVAGVRITGQTLITRMSLLFVLSLVQSAMILVLLAVFGGDTRRPVEIANVILPNALSTALVSPFLLKLAQILRQGGPGRRATPAPLESSAV